MDEDVDPIADAYDACIDAERVRLAVLVLNLDRRRKADRDVLFGDLVTLTESCRCAAPEAWLAIDACEVFDAIDLALEAITGFNSARINTHLNIGALTWLTINPR